MVLLEHRGRKAPGEPAQVSASCDNSGLWRKQILSPRRQHELAGPGRPSLRRRARRSTHLIHTSIQRDIEEARERFLPHFPGRWAPSLLPKFVEHTVHLLAVSSRLSVMHTTSEHPARRVRPWLLRLEIICRTPLDSPGSAAYRRHAKWKEHVEGKVPVRAERMLFCCLCRLISEADISTNSSRSLVRCFFDSATSRFLVPSPSSVTDRPPRSPRWSAGCSPRHRRRRDRILWDALCPFSTD